MTQPMTPEQEEQVRRALAAAAEAEDAETPPTMPPAVGARLDRVLAELVQGRSNLRAASSAPGPGPDQLAAQRARRRLNVLVAAAALAVIVAAGGAVVTGGLGAGGSTSSDSQAGGLADNGVAQPEAAAPTAPSGASGSGGSADPGAGEPRLRASTLATDVRRVLRSEAVDDQSQEARKLTVRPDGSACERPTLPRGADVVDVRLDGEPATLVVDRETDGAREARVYSCEDASTPVATTTVPAP